MYHIVGPPSPPRTVVTVVTLITIIHVTPELPSSMPPTPACMCVIEQKEKLLLLTYIFVETKIDIKKGLRKCAKLQDLGVVGTIVIVVVLGQ